MATCWNGYLPCALHIIICKIIDRGKVIKTPYCARYCCIQIALSLSQKIRQENWLIGGPASPWSLHNEFLGQGHIRVHILVNDFCSKEIGSLSSHVRRPQEQGLFVACQHHTRGAWANVCINLTFRWDCCSTFFLLNDSLLYKMKDL